MEEYTVVITEELCKRIKVKAKNPAEAEKMVRQMYQQEEIILSADDFVGVDFAVEE